MTGGADVDKAVFNKTSGLFTFGDIVSAGANNCINGDCSLPGETTVVDSGCFSAVTVFTVDYDAPISAGTQSVRAALEPLVKYQNSTKGTTSKRDLASRSARMRLVGL